MQGQEIEIKHCSICQPIDRNEAKYQTDIIATSCTWRENLEVDYTLQTNPVIYKTYFVTLDSPVKFFVNMEIWLFYDCPLAFYNGYENEEEIELANFCFGRITNLVSSNEHGATIEFLVSKVLSFQDILNSREKRDLPKFWTDFLIGFIKKEEFSFATFGRFHVLSVDAQGDLGLNCVFTEFENEYMICMVNDWSFSENGKFGGKYRLPDELKILIK